VFSGRTARAPRALDVEGRGEALRELVAAVAQHLGQAVGDVGDDAVDAVVDELAASSGGR
jgi:hypothetical protein